MERVGQRQEKREKEERELVVDGCGERERKEEGRELLQEEKENNASSEKEEKIRNSGNKCLPAAPRICQWSCSDQLA